MFAYLDFGGIHAVTGRNTRFYPEAAHGAPSCSDSDNWYIPVDIFMIPNTPAVTNFTAAFEICNQTGSNLVDIETKKPIKTWQFSEVFDLVSQKTVFSGIQYNPEVANFYRARHDGNVSLSVDQQNEKSQTLNITECHCVCYKKLKKGQTLKNSAVPVEILAAS